MMYTARQLHCLDAMGMVPWVPRSHTRELPLDNTAVNEPLANVSMPVELDKLQAWLGQQPLASFVVAGRARSVTGPEDAALLVVVQPDQGLTQQALDGDASRLFDLMMRAIGLSRQTLRLGCLSSEPGDDDVLVSDVCNHNTKAVLLMQQNWDVDNKNFSTDAEPGTLAFTHAPLWRIPHPDVLLRHNRLKRHAWQALKALQRVL